MDASVPVLEAKRFTDLSAQAANGWRWRARLGILLTLVCGLLTFTGLYGLLATSISDQHRELAIRAALGERRLHLTMSMTGRLFVVSVLGSIVGAITSYSLGAALRAATVTVFAPDVRAVWIAACVVGGVATLLCGTIGLRAWPSHLADVLKRA